MTPDITCKSVTQIGYKFQDGGQNGGRETLYLAVTQPFINKETSFFFTELCVMTPDISCRRLTHPFTNSKMADKLAAVKHYNLL